MSLSKMQVLGWWIVGCVPHVYTGWASADRGFGSESVYEVVGV